MAKDFVINLKKPEDTPQDIANKLNSLHSAVDVSVIAGALSRDEFEKYKGNTDKVVSGYEDRINYNVKNGTKKLSDLRWHGGGTDTTTVTGILKGNGNGTAISAAIPGVDYVTAASTNTFTNKRITRRVVTVTQSATPTINTDNTDIASITGLAQAITSFTTNLTGTPNAGDLLMIQFTDNGTARAITWGASFASTTITLPTTTVISTLLRVGFQWNAVSNTWDCIAVA